MTEGTTTVWRISDATTNTMFIHVTDSDSDVRNTWCLLNLIKYKYEHTHVKVICETEGSSARKRRPTIEHLLHLLYFIYFLWIVLGDKILEFGNKMSMFSGANTCSLLLSWMHTFIFNSNLFTYFLFILLFFLYLLNLHIHAQYPPLKMKLWLAGVGYWPHVLII